MVFSVEEKLLGFVVLSFFAVLPQFFVVLGDMDPEVVPLDSKVADI